MIADKYKMIKRLGKGTFSRVFECASFDDNNNGKNSKKKKKRYKKQRYAVKVIRNTYKYQRSAQNELQVLRKIRDTDPNNISCCIHMMKQYRFLGHPIFIFPLLGQSLHSFMVQNKNKPFYSDVRCN